MFGEGNADKNGNYLANESLAVCKDVLCSVLLRNVSGDYIRRCIRRRPLRCHQPSVCHLYSQVARSNRFSFSNVLYSFDAISRRRQCLSRYP